MEVNGAKYSVTTALYMLLLLLKLHYCYTVGAFSIVIIKSFANKKTRSKVYGKLCLKLCVDDQ